jgi:YHS domain-containing protein
MWLDRPRARRLCAGVPLVFLFLGSTQASVRASDGDPEAGAEPGLIAWRTDYARALDEAKTGNQLIWIQFTGPWCPNCTRMERDSFPHPAVRAHAERSVVPLKLRADLNEELALGFGLSGLPATVILAPSREVFAVRQGYLGPEELGDLLREAKARHTTEQERNRQMALSKSSERGEEGREPNSKSKTKTETHVALSGYCPVSLVSDRKLVQGQTEYTVTHEGRLYRFANMLTFNLFRRDPERFVPVNNGNCPVTQVELGKRQPGNPKFGVLYQGRLYLCATDADRKQFFSSPDRYAAVDVAEQGLCPHCLAESGERIPGDPRYDLTREGRRYWFPDPAHREAFLSASADSISRR